jgi:hypothetical protein
MTSCFESHGTLSFSPCISLLLPFVCLNA